MLKALHIFAAPYFETVLSSQCYVSGRMSVNRMIAWVHSNEMLLGWLAGSSVFIFLASLLAIPFLVVRIPPDYFRYGKRKAASPFASHHPAVRLFLRIVQNVLGYVCIGLGIVMLVLPGQGILTIVAGLILIHFPGKDRFLMWLVRRKSVLKSINWLRQRSGRRPIVMEERSR